MSDHESVRNGTTASIAHDGSVAGSDLGVAEFLDDLVSLAELHLKLTVVDFTENARRATPPLGITLSSLTVIAASVPVLLLGLALIVATRLDIQQGWGMILVAGGTVGVACAPAVFGVVRLRRGFDSFRTSREELKRNLVWLRKVLIARRRSHHWRGT